MEPCEAQRRDVEGYVSHLEDADYAPNTICCQRIATLSSLYRCAVAEHHVPRNPVDGAHRPRKPSESTAQGVVSRGHRLARRRRSPLPPRDEDPLYLLDEEATCAQVGRDLGGFIPAMWRGQRTLLRGVAAQPYSRTMMLLARVLGFGLDVLQALPRRGRVSSILAAAMLLTFGLWPELLLEVARLRAQPILEAVTEFVQDVGSRAQGR